MSGATCTVDALGTTITCEPLPPPGSGMPEGATIRYMTSDGPSVRNEDGASTLDGTATTSPSISNPALAGTARVSLLKNQITPGTMDFVFATNTQSPVNFAKGWGYYQTDLGSPAIHAKPVWDTKGSVDVPGMSQTQGVMFLVARSEQTHNNGGGCCPVHAWQMEPLLGDAYGGYFGINASNSMENTTLGGQVYTLTSSATAIATTADTTAYHLYVVVRGQSGWEVRLDGQSLGTLPLPSNNFVRRFIFGTPGTALYGFWKDFAYYPNGLSPEQIASAEAYLMDLYNLN